MNIAPRCCPRIYALDPVLVHAADWDNVLRRCAGMGFDHVLLLSPTLVPALAAGAPQTMDAAAGISDLAALEQLATQCAALDMRLLLDLDLSGLDAEDPMVRTHPGLFVEHGNTSDLPDPRRAGDQHQIERRGGQRRLPRYDSPEQAAALAALWRSRLETLIEAGVAGFRCQRPARTPADFWQTLISAIRAERPCCHFLAWTPGCTRKQLAGLAHCGFDAVFSSDAWWDFQAGWYWQEHEALVAVAPVIAFPEDPCGTRLARLHGFRQGIEQTNAARRAILFAAASGAGWLLPMGFEYGLNTPLAVSGRTDALTTPEQYAQACAAAEVDLSDTVREANALLVAHAETYQASRLRPLSAPGAPALLVERRGAAQRQLIVLNTRLDQTTRVTRQQIQERLAGWTPEAEPGAVAGSNEAIHHDLMLAPAALKILALQAPKPVLTAPNRRVRPDPDKMRAARIVIETVSPVVDGGRFAAKRTVGKAIDIEADIFIDGHEKIGAAVLVRAADEKEWRREPMHLLGNDRWRASVQLNRPGRHFFCIEAWHDVFATYLDELKKKAAAGLDLTLELEEGRLLIAASSKQALTASAEPGIKREMAALLKALAAARPRGNASGDQRLALLTDEHTAQLMTRLAHRPFLVRTTLEYPLEAERTAAGYASWYELFPRSQTEDPGRHGNFDDVIARLPAIRAMGFDTLYFPPIHPIGERHRKGKNNSLQAGPDDPGSPYAIGNAQGGHDAIHPQLGTLDDFLRLRDAASVHGLELALDFAIQCSPDHPWLQEHPGWFAWRPDGSLRYAENPPKKYEDIVNVDFYAEDAIPDLWQALRDVVLFWAAQGVRAFRVDNPHTKPFPFWEWLIATVRGRYPDVLFLSEAFTRPKPMYRLAKLGFSQSYTYFTWRHGKQEFTDYLTELTQSPVAEYFRPHFFVNTPDINPHFLQQAGRPGFLIRAALAATLSGLWGIYSGFELCEAQAVSGKEEYLDSEKYQIRVRDWQQPGNIIAEISRLNRIRSLHPALQSHCGVQFLPSSNDQILLFAKSTPAATDAARSRGLYGDNVILVAINLDPYHTQHADIEVPLYKFGLHDDASLDAENLLDEKNERWQGKQRQLTLDPQLNPYAIWRLQPAEV